jgi:hypothetical protein
VAVDLVLETSAAVQVRVDLDQLLQPQVAVDHSKLL